VAPLELKKQRLDASVVAQQLQAGSDAAEQIVGREHQVGIRPVAVCGELPTPNGAA